MPAVSQVKVEILVRLADGLWKFHKDSLITVIECDIDHMFWRQWCVPPTWSNGTLCSCGWVSWKSHRDNKASSGQSSWGSHPAHDAAAHWRASTDAFWRSKGVFHVAQDSWEYRAVRNSLHRGWFWTTGASGRYLDTVPCASRLEIGPSSSRRPPYSRE